MVTDQIPYPQRTGLDPEQQQDGGSPRMSDLSHCHGDRYQRVWNLDLRAHLRSAMASSNEIAQTDDQRHYPEGSADENGG